MFVIKFRKIFYAMSAVIIALSIFATIFWGINFGIDFTGGSILEINFSTERPDKSEIESNLANLGLEKEFSVRETGEAGYILRSRTIEDSEKNIIMASLTELSPGFEEVRFSNIGPTLGSELRSRAIVAITLVVLSIIIFVAIAFSEVSKPVSSWKYGVIAVMAFIHDVVVPIGLFAFLGQFYGVEVDTLFVIAILVVLGYSINDTIVVFDRIRENLKNAPEKQRISRFDEIVGHSLEQTYSRSINTSLTTLFALTALFIFGGQSTLWFSMALIAGIIAGTYSSIFFAAPMLVTFSKFVKK